MMQYKDDRVKWYTSFLDHIRVIRAICWEDIYIGNINLARSKEVKYLKFRKYLDAFCVFLWGSTPFIVVFSTLYTVYSMGEEITAAKAFTAITLLNILIYPMNAFPWILNGLLESFVSGKRIQDFLFNTHLSDVIDYTPPSLDSDVIINYKNCSFSTINNPELTLLHNISFEMKKNEKIAVIGKVGSGKSMLLLSLLNEMNCFNSENYHTNNISYCSQTPWIPNDTIKNIITFYSNIDENRYKKVIEACSLRKDIDKFPGKDNAEIGYNGINLSGGQKQRMCLARTIYNDTDLYLLDDVFASLDAIVTENVYNSLFNNDNGLLLNKSVILVTHNLKIAQRFDRIILIEDGKIIKDGKTEEVMKQLKSKIDDIQESINSLVEGGESSGQLIFDEHKEV